MDLIRFYLSSANLPRGKLLFHSALAGGTNVLVLALLNLAAENAANRETEVLLLVLFALNILVFLISQKYIWHTATVEVESLVHDVRMDLVHKLNACDLQNLEKMQRSDIYAAVNQHSGNIAFAGVPTIVSLQSFVLLAFSLVYVAWLSFYAFILITLFLSIAVYFAYKRTETAGISFAEAIDKEKKAYAAITDLVEGFKEVKLHQPREKALIEYGEQLSFDAEAARMVSNRHLAMSYIATQTSFYVTIAVMIFLLPLLDTNTFVDAVVSITTAAIFITGPINIIISVVPTYTNSQASLHFIRSMKETLTNGKEANDATIHPMPTFESLKFKEIGYQFASDGDKGFAVGPISLEVKAGEVVFLTGGNGSGKSTLIKAMLGLYTVKTGEIRFNDQIITANDIRSYRSCFSAIFADFHLFRRLYGIDEIDHQEVQDLLTLFQLQDKTTLTDGEFSTQNLSTGQRKRLALIVAILEKRPILVLDEWAADQDPEYRKIFYRTILPRLKAEGRTILAITHDEQYFDACDHRYHLVEGKLTKQYDYE